MSIFITGFSLFSNLTNNPTEDLIKRLNECCKQETPTTCKLPLNTLIQKGDILEVSEEGVCKGLNELWKTAQCSFTYNLDKRCYNDTTILSVNNNYGITSVHDPVLYLHLGVMTNTTTFRLEKFGYNEKKFRVEDVRGLQPQNEAIVIETPTSAKKQTSLDVDSLCKSLQELNYPVEVSEDPGRYLCNMCYYLSLCGAEKQNNCYSLFIHVPPSEVMPLDNQLNFILEILNLWYSKKISTL